MHLRACRSGLVKNFPKNPCYNCSREYDAYQPAQTKFKNAARFSRGFALFRVASVDARLQILEAGCGKFGAQIT